jgi:hypothetical protein
MIEMVNRVPPQNRHLLRAEGGCCLEYDEGGCMVLAVGEEALGDGARQAIALRQEVLACLWATLLTRRGEALRSDCRLYRLPCRWSVEPENGVLDADESWLRREVCRTLQKVWLVKPEGIFPLIVGDTFDDSVALAVLVGLEEGTRQRHAFLFAEKYVERLWQTLLLGPGAVFASPDGELGRIFGLE